MRASTLMWRVAAALLMCLALAHMHTTEPSAASGLQRSAGGAFALAQNTAFDDDDQLARFGNDDDDDSDAEAAAVPVQRSTSSKSSRTAAPVPAAAAAGELDPDEAAALLADSDEFVGATDVPVPDTAASSSKGSKQGKKGAPAAASSSRAGAAGSEPTIGNVLQAPQSFFQPLGLGEYVGAALVLVYILNFLRGSRVNRRLAAQWAQVTVPLLREQFAAVGEGSDDNAAAEPSTLLIKDSEHSYKLFASGRRWVRDGALLTLELVPRQDLLSLLLSLMHLGGGMLGIPSRDSVTLEIPLEEDALQPLSFALVRKRQGRKALRGTAGDLDALPMKPPSARGLDEYACVSDAGAEAEEALLGERAVRVLSRPACADLFLAAHLSDASTVPFSSSQKVARWRFSLPKDWTTSAAQDDSPVGALQQLTSLALHAIDRAAEFKLSPAARARSEARRKKLAEASAKASARSRAEEVARKREEQRRKEAELIASDPNSEQARELLRKKEAREIKQAKKAKNAGIKMMR